MNPLTWQNPGQLFVAQDVIKVNIYSVAELRLYIYLELNYKKKTNIYCFSYRLFTFAPSEIKKIETMNKKMLITFLCFSAISPMMAQDVKGKIVDEKGQPLAFANVVLLNRQDSAFVKGVVSGEDGHFAIDSPCNNGKSRLRL